jgi:hypothetical protein
MAQEGWEERESWEDREDREDRPARRDKKERKQSKPVTYKYRFQNSPKKPVVLGSIFPKLGEIISTKQGPCKVLEIFWRTATDAVVMLQPTEPKTIPEKLAVKEAMKKSARSAKPAKPAKPVKSVKPVKPIADAAKKSVTKPKKS